MGFLAAAAAVFGAAGTGLAGCCRAFAVFFAVLGLLIVGQ